MRSPRFSVGATLVIVLLAVTPVFAEAPPRYTWEVVSRRPHDTSAFTQGLVLDRAGRLFESVGEYGRSDLREVDAQTGSILRQVPLTDEQFGEGLALVDDTLIQLTWREGQALAWDVETFEATGTFDYEGDGWGLCLDDGRLVMSDGSDELTFRDAASFAILGSVSVTLDGQPVLRLNELECVNGLVWANVWNTDRIVHIDPDSGRVIGVLDLSGIIEPHPAHLQSTSVLNGIAYDADSDRYLVTGKRWPELIEIVVDVDVAE